MSGLAKYLTDESKSKAKKEFAALVGKGAGLKNLGSSSMGSMGSTAKGGLGSTNLGKLRQKRN